MNWSNTINEHSLYMFENFLFSSEGVLRCKDKEVYLYKINIKENTPVAFYTNYVFYDNFNKTLPVGMDISTEILFDTFKSKIKEINLKTIVPVTFFYYKNDK